MSVTRFESIVSAQSIGTQDVDKLAASFEKLAGWIESSGKKADKVSEHPGFDHFAEKVKAGIEDPLHAASEAMDSVLKAAGPMGTAVAAGIGIFTAVGVAGFEAAKGLGEYGDHLERISARMGLSNRETADFIFSLRRSGGDMESLETITRKLSTALVDTSEDGKKGRAALAELGIKAYDDAGKLRPMADIIVQIGEALEGMESTAKRNDAAVKIMGRGALSVLPDLLKLSEGLRRAHETGLSPSDEDVERWSGYHRQIAEAEARWDALARKVKEPIAGVFTVTMRGATGDLSDIAEGAAKALRGQIGKIPTAEAEKRLQQLEGWISEQVFAELRKQIQTADMRTSLDTSGMLGLTLEGLTSGMKEQVARALRSGTGDDKGQIHDAEEKLKSLQGQLEAKRQLGAPLPGQLELAEEVEKQRAVVTALEARIKKTEELKAAEKELQTFELAMREVGQDPIEKLFLRRDELMKKGANADRAWEAAREGATQLLAKGYKENADEAEKIQLKVEDYFSKSWAAIYQEANYTADQILTSFLKASQKVEEIEAHTKVARLQANSQNRMSFLGLAAGPGQEVALINAQYAERLRLAQETYAVENAQALRVIEKDQQRTALAHAYATLVNAQYEAEREQELRIGELQRKRLDELRNLSGQFFDALTQGRGGIEQFFKNLGKSWARTMFENFATEELKGLSGHLSLPGQGTSANPTLLGRVLAGTPFGLDPLKDQASVKLSTAGVELSTAAGELMAAARSLAVSSSGGGGGLVRGGVGIFTRAGAIGAEGVQEGNAIPWGVNGDVAGETAHPVGSWNWNEAIGIGGAAAGGAVGIYAGLKGGGARGAMTAAGSAVAMTGAILSMASKALKIAGPIGEVAGIALGLATMLLPDARAARDRQESERLAAARYMGPVSTNYTRDRYGRDYDTDVSGNVRPLIGEVHINALDPRAAADAVLDAMSIGLEAKRNTRAAMALRNTVRG